MKFIVLVLFARIGFNRLLASLVYRLKASAWYGRLGFYSRSVKIVFVAFAPGAPHKRKCEGFCA